LSTGIILPFPADEKPFLQNDHVLIENGIQLHRIQTSIGADCDRYLAVAEVRERMSASKLTNKDWISRS
jgi:hypothetical protein